MKLVEDIIKAFGEIITWLLEIKKKPAAQNRNITSKVVHAVQKVEPVAQKPNHTVQSVTPFERERSRAVQNVESQALQKPAPSIKIEPKDFFHWAGNDLARWKLLIGASIKHAYYGKGSIEKAFWADQRSDKIYLSINLQRDGCVVFFASDFDKDDKPFNELLVDTACNNEFQKSAFTPAAVAGKPKDHQVKWESQKETSLQFPADLGCWRKDWDGFAKILEQHRIRYLYHFTDAANIPSIVEHGGLYSWWSCQKNGITIPKPGGNETSRELDRRKELQDYVRLSFNDNHPMIGQAKHEGRIEKLVILRISSEVIYWDSALFSNLNATANGAQIGNCINDFKKINFEIATQPYFDEHTKSFYQAEVLVKTHIPIKYILNIP